MNKCYVCGKMNLTKDEVGLSKKLISKDEKVLFCISCLAEQLEVTVDELNEKIDEFKEEGCKLFK